MKLIKTCPDCGAKELTKPALYSALLLVTAAIVALVVYCG